MSRGLRRLSVTGYTHVIVRGNNKQILFEGPDDSRFFISRLGKYSREEKISLNAFCLMENHVHLLVNDPQGNVSAMMHHLNLSYSKYYNQKYERIGHLYQGRFLSEPVETEAYLFTVFRYILNNPQKAGICPAAKYRWSSYKAYFNDYPTIDLAFIRDRYPTAEAFREYMNEPNEDECLEYQAPKTSDEAALEIIRNNFNVKTPTELQSWEKPKRAGALRQLKSCGLSIRQLERLTGLGRGIIARA